MYIFPYQGRDEEVAKKAIVSFLTMIFGLDILLQFIYQLYQTIVIALFSPNPPRPNAKLRPQHIAIIGAGLTGVSAAAHCIGHGFNVTIFEAGSHRNLGGIWSRVNKTSGLQIHSLMYRFHPSVRWERGFPTREGILQRIERVWREYGLQKRTRFNVAVKSVRRTENGKWIVNGEEQEFDGVIVAVGTCGEPKMPMLPGEGEFGGRIVHSSELDNLDVEGKKVVVIGGGASAVEAVEYTVLNNAKKISILARSDKWIIPRNPLADILLSIKPIGYEDYFAYLPEFLLKKFFYRDLEDLAPEKGLWESTPMVNDQVLAQIRQGKVEWLRGDIQRLEKDGIQFNKRDKGVPKGGPGRPIFANADIIILATGYNRPSLHFLPPECFEDPYSPPNWYLQSFPPKFATICAINCTYINAIGTVGHFHIGAYTRILLTFILDPITRPGEWLMKAWVDLLRVLKHFAPTGPLEFFTYGEMMLWFIFFVMIRISRWRWGLFILFGWGLSTNDSRSVVEEQLVEGEFNADSS